MNVKIGVSARHMHITKEDLEYFYGEGFKLVPERGLSQTGEFASTSKLIVKGPKGELKVRILGPVRKYTQIEISKTDAVSIGINPPIRNSGDLEGSHPVVLSDGVKELYKDKGCIISTRHIHINYEDLDKYRLSLDEKVKVKVGGEKPAIMENVHIKASKDFVFEMHIDTDDANANLINNGDIGEIIR